MVIFLSAVTLYDLKVLTFNHNFGYFIVSRKINTPKMTLRIDRRGVSRPVGRALELKTSA